MRCVLFLHGFLGSPEQFAPLEAAVREMGIATHVLTLPGHKGTLADFLRHGRKDWEAAVTDAVRSLSESYTELYLCTHSMGGLLALNAYGEHPDLISGIFALALPLSLRFSLHSLRMYHSILSVPSPDDPPEVRAGREFLGVSGLRMHHALRLLPNSLGFCRLQKKGRRILRRGPLPLTAVWSKRDEIVSLRSAVHSRGNTAILLTESTHFWYSEREQNVLQHELTEMLK